MTKEDTRKLIAVMQAYVDGKQIQCTDDESENWIDVESPEWDPNYDCVLTSTSFLAALSLKKRTFLRILMIETTTPSCRACKRPGTAGRLRRAKMTDWALTNIS